MRPPKIRPLVPSESVCHLARRWVEYVSVMRSDCEEAHMAEDDLWFGALFWIEQNGVQHPEVAAELAAIATDTVSVRFSRWYS